ncbi:MAG: TonB-dependent receptor domain-containing protein [Acidobacteriota bacterium]
MRTKGFRWRFWLVQLGLCLTIALLASGMAAAQIKSGAITGSVVDTSGGAVPGAEVTVTNEETNLAVRAITSDVGDFLVPYLAPGRYTLTVQMPGFKAYQQNGVALATAQTVRVTARLEVGEVTTTVEVKSDTGQLQTENSSVQGLTERTVIETLPNITHNPYTYAILQPGVVPRQGMQDTQGFNSFGVGIDSRRNFSAMTVNGGMAFSNDITLDGVSVQGSAWNEAAVVPNSEGLEEVRTIVNNFSAEYGRAQGVISLTTKSGTNRLHGSAFYRSRNDAFNANSFNNNARRIDKPAFKVHSYGATAGGPIVKDKAFFFVSYEGLMHHKGIDFLRKVPTAEERIGDFSQTLRNVNGTPTPQRLFDPFKVTAVGGGNYQRAEIANAIIPNPSPYIVKLFSYYPLPNRTPDDVYNTNNYYYYGIQDFGRTSLNSRLDYQSGRSSLYATWGISQGEIVSPNAWGPDNPFYNPDGFVGRFNNDRNPYFSLGDTITLSPTLVFDLRYGVNRINTNNEVGAVEGFDDYSQFGVPSAIAAIIPVPGVPPSYQINVNSWSPLQSGGSLNKRERQTNHQLVFSGTKTRDRWTFKFGGEFRVYLSNYTDAQASVMIVPFADHTRGGTINASGGGVGSVTAESAGHEGASLLLGSGFLRVSQGQVALMALAQKYFALYSQNTWRATDRLTVNLGLRWDLQPGPTERFNRFSSFSFSGDNPFYGAGGIYFPGVDGAGRNLWETQWKDFGPRIGLAYQFSKDLVVRAGYGITYLPTNTGYFDGPFTYGANPFVSGTFNLPYGPTPAGVIVGTMDQTTQIVPITGPDKSAPALYGGTTNRFPYDDYRNGMVQQWNFFVERKLAADWTVSAGYIGSKGDHLPVARVDANSIQYLPPSQLAAWRQTYIDSNGKNNPANTQVPNPLQPATGALIPFQGVQGSRTIQQWWTMVPYPLFGSMVLERSFGFSNYHALQAQVTRRFSQGLLLNAHYTWSKSLSFAGSESHNNGYSDTGSLSVFNQVDLGANKSVSLQDIPHRFVLTSVYDLPFGKNRRFSLDHPILQGIVSGWKLSGLFSVQSGFPLLIEGGNTGSLNGRPDRLPGVAVEVPKELQRWYDGKTKVTLPGGTIITPCNFCFLKYNVEAFRGRVVTTPNGSTITDINWYGNASYGFSDIRSLGQTNFDMAVERRFDLTEQFSLDFSARASNVLNMTRFLPSGVTRSLGGTNVLTTGNLQPGVGNNSSFGVHGMGTFAPREIEFQLRLRF